jgi:pimeloyl-ACP methyl ester carboxylesterase
VAKRKRPYSLSCFRLLYKIFFFAPAIVFLFDVVLKTIFLMRFLKITGIILLLLIGVYFIGPHPASPFLTDPLPEVPSDPAELENFILQNERKHRLKPDNEARIIWYNDSLKEKTGYALVYLHGFSASQKEGDPVHISFARKFGCNLYLARLADHGVDTSEPMANLTADKLWESAKAAYATGLQLADKVILMGTSTGATLALQLAARYPGVHALILLSPNIAINDANAWMLNNPWGLQIARLIKGKYVQAPDSTALYARYWYPKYRIESAVQLEELLEATMKESTFASIKQPVLVLYYYKDEENQDPVVKVTAMKRMFAQLATPDSLKRMIAIPEAGDHVIGSSIKSKDVQSVMEECMKFGKEVLHLKEPANNPDNKCNQQAEQNHGGDGKIKPEIIFFNADITRQAAQPVQFVVK